MIRSLNPGSYDRWPVSMAGGNAPHIMEFETKRMASFADKGLLLEFTKYAARRRSAGSGPQDELRQGRYAISPAARYRVKGERFSITEGSGPGAGLPRQVGLVTPGMGGRRLPCAS